MTDILYYPNTRYASREELFEDVSRRLVALGYVDDSFERAIKEREESYPTGLPLDPPVAIPHTDGTYVKHDVIVCIRNGKDIPFNEMGAGPESVLEVRLIFMLVMASGADHLDELQRLVNNLQDSSTVKAAIEAPDDESFRKIADSCI